MILVPVQRDKCHKSLPVRIKLLGWVSVEYTLEVTLPGRYTYLEAWSTHLVVLLSRILYPCGESPVIVRRLTAFCCSSALSRTFLFRQFLHYRATLGSLEQHNQYVRASPCHPCLGD
jgi:hypothetical protein